MKQETNIFTHIYCRKRTKKQVELLAKIQNAGDGANMYDLVGTWADDAWEKAKAAGLVNDSMLPADVKAHWIGVDVGAGDEKTVVTETPRMMPRKKRVQQLGRDR
jgi:hypothetical protein